MASEKTTKHAKSHSASSSLGDLKSATVETIAEVTSTPVSRAASFDTTTLGPEGPYRLYKWRFVGLAALTLLNIAAGLNSTWFGPIAVDVANDYGFTVTQVNWLGNTIHIVGIFGALIVPISCKRMGMRNTCWITSAVMAASAWVRYAGTASSLSVRSSYALFMVGQILSAAPQPMLQVIATLYSETWFDMQGRTTSTMLISLADPLGGAVASIIAPLPGSTRSSILLLTILSSAVAPFALAIKEKPPTPPTFAATQSRPGWMSLLRALAGLEPRENLTYMTIRERFDFLLLLLNFAAIFGVIGAFSLLTAEYLLPYGYSADSAGLVIGLTGLVGLISAIITAPLFDRVLTNHLAMFCKILAPILGALWFSLIWAVKSNNLTALYIIMAFAGVCAVPMLPIALELAVELTRNADCSSALLWLAGSITVVVFVALSSALRAGPEATPPFNLHRSFVVQGILVLSLSLASFLLRGKQARRERDEESAKRGAVSEP